MCLQNFWFKEHKETIAAGATVTLGAVLLVIPGTQEFGLGILLGAGIGGGLSFLTGNDLKTVMKDIASLRIIHRRHWQSSV